MGFRHVTNIWRIDGDFYQAVIPTQETWYQMSLYGIPSDWNTKAVLFSHHDGIGITPGFALGNEATCEYTVLDPADYGEWALVRPVLIPLDKDLNPISKAFEQDNPDWTKVYGGTPGFLDYDGLKKPVFSEIPYMQKPSAVWIGDTSAVPAVKRLKWYVWKGCLYCTEPVFYSTPNVIKSGHFLQQNFLLTN